MARNEQNMIFGVESEEKMMSQASYNLWQTFIRLVPLRFWLRYYIISLIVFSIFHTSYFYSVTHSFKEYSLFLFPMTIYWYSRMLSRLRVNGSFLFNFFSLHTIQSGSIGCLGTLIGVFIKLFIIYILWFYSFVLGGFGIIFFLLDFKRLRR